MKAIIPVAGYGTRMRPHTLTQPKVLLPVADKPMIAHIVEKLIADGVDELIFVVGYLGDRIEAFIKKTYPIQSHFLEQKEFLGLGHAIYTANSFLKDEPIFIVLGDTIYDVDLKGVMQGKNSALGTRKVADPSRFGVALMDNNGYIEKLIEKPKNFISDIALVGVYYFKNGHSLNEALSTLISENIKTKNEYQLTDALQIMIDKGENFEIFDVDSWYDCGKPETLLETNAIILKRDFMHHSFKVENSVIVPPVYIHPSAKVINSIIGPNVTVGEKSNIENAIVSESIINSNSSIRKINMKSSLIGMNVKIEGEGKTLNLGDYSHLTIY